MIWFSLFEFHSDSYKLVKRLNYIGINYRFRFQIKQDHTNKNTNLILLYSYSSLLLNVFYFIFYQYVKCQNLFFYKITLMEWVVNNPILFERLNYYSTWEMFMHQKWHIQTWAPQSQSWGMWGKHEEPYIYTCPFHMPRKEIDPKNISSLWLLTLASK